MSGQRRQDKWVGPWCCLLAAERAAGAAGEMYIRDGSAQTIVSATTMREKLQINVAISPSIPTQRQPVLAQTFKLQAPDRIATRRYLTVISNRSDNPNLPCSLLRWCLGRRME